MRVSVLCKACDGRGEWEYPRSPKNWGEVSNPQIMSVVCKVCNGEGWHLLPDESGQAQPITQPPGDKGDTE